MGRTICCTQDGWERICCCSIYSLGIPFLGLVAMAIAAIEFDMDSPFGLEAAIGGLSLGGLWTGVTIWLVPVDFWWNFCLGPMNPKRWESCPEWMQAACPEFTDRMEGLNEWEQNLKLEIESMPGQRTLNWNMSNLPKEALGYKTFNGVCSICDKNYCANDVIKTLKCGDVYHRDCIDEWLTNQNDATKCYLHDGDGKIGPHRERTSF